MFQESELINFALGVIGLGVLIWFGDRKALPRCLFFGYLCLLASYVATLVEGVVAHDLFNILEHLFLAGSGAFFAVGIRRLGKTDTAPDAESQP